MTVPNAYDTPNGIVLRKTFVDQNGNLIDPTAVSVKVNDPDGIQDIYTYPGGGVTKASQGTYTCTVIGDLTGRWDYSWRGVVNGVTVTQDGYFLMKGSVFSI